MWENFEAGEESMNEIMFILFYIRRVQSELHLIGIG